MPGRQWLPLLKRIQFVIVQSELAEIPAANVVIQMAATDRLAELGVPPRPAILITPHAGEQLAPELATNLRDGVRYPVSVSLLCSNDLLEPDALACFTHWRAELMQLFHNRPLAETKCFLVQVEPLEVVDRAVLVNRKLWLCRLLLHCFFRELRN